MNSDNIVLKQETYAGLTTDPTGITVTQFDDNNINIYKDFEQLQISLGVPAYDAGTTYDDQYDDSESESFATSGGRFWMWVNAVEGSGATPVSGADWQEVFPTILAHERNKDDKLKSMDGFTVKIDDSGAFPFANIEYKDPSSDWFYAVGVQDLSGVSGDKQCAVSAYNTVTNEQIGIRITNALIEMKHTDTSNNPTAEVHVKDSKILVKTPNVLNSTALVGDVLTMQALDGEVEFQTP